MCLRGALLPVIVEAVTALEEQVAVAAQVELQVVEGDLALLIQAVRAAVRLQVGMQSLDVVQEHDGVDGVILAVQLAASKSESVTERIVGSSFIKILALSHS